MSMYESNPFVTPVVIKGYPKRRPAGWTFRPLPLPVDITYADFFAPLPAAPVELAS